MQTFAYLGDKPFCYLTTYAEDANTAFSKINGAKLVLNAAMLKPLREKIEVIIHDTKEKQ